MYIWGRGRGGPGFKLSIKQVKVALTHCSVFIKIMLFSKHYVSFYAFHKISLKDRNKMLAFVTLRIPRGSLFS